MRLWAKKHGWKLTDEGLFPRAAHEGGHGGPAGLWPVGLRGGGGVLAFGSEARVEARSEADIFTLLGLEYRAPEDRNVLDVAPAADMGGGVVRGVGGDGGGCGVLAADAAHRAQKKHRTLGCGTWR